MGFDGIEIVSSSDQGLDGELWSKAMASAQSTGTRVGLGVGRLVFLGEFGVSSLAHGGIWVILT